MLFGFDGFIKWRQITNRQQVTSAIRTKRKPTIRWLTNSLETIVKMHHHHHHQY